MAEEQQKLIQKIYAEQQMTESNLGLMQQRLEAIQVYLTNYRSGFMVLEEIEKKEEGEEMLLNVGGSIFVEAKLVNPNKVTRGLGSGIRIEQSVTAAKEVVSEALESLEKQYEKLAQEYQTLLQRTSVLNTQFQQLAAQIQSTKPPGEEE
jgi:prefoldin alpha subunit